MLAAVVLAGCAANPAVNEGRRMIAEGRIDEGLAHLERVARENPGNATARNTWITQREAATGALLKEGDQYRLWGDYDQADTAYRRALGIDRTSTAARNGVDAVARERALAQRVREAEGLFARGDVAGADRLTRAVLAENSAQRGARTLMKSIAERQSQASVEPPQLTAALGRRLTLEFRDAPIRSVFEVIARESGINFVFDRDVRPDIRVTLFVRDTTIDDLVRLMLATNQLARKVMNENSVLVYPNTPAKQREYVDTVVRSFYLANADVKQTAALIRAMVKTRDLFIDEKLNLVVMRDTPEAVRLAEQLVATQDLGDPEVMLEVEVLEVATSRVQEFGVRYPDRINLGTLSEGTNTQTIGQGGVIINTPVPGAPPGVAELRPHAYKWWVANPAFVLNLRQLDGTVNLLANPRIRVKNREKAKIHIGEKVPVITTTSTANVGVSSSVNYLEVGLKLDVEPNVHLEDEVGMKVQLEVSNILEQLNVSGTISYRLGTRNTATSLRLRDGETQVLAGLINDEERRASNKVPYLGEVPLLGKLFTSDNDQRGKTEIVLLITPRVLRNLARPDTVAAQFPGGTEAQPGALPLRIASTPAGGLAMATAGGGSAPTPLRGPNGRGPQVPERVVETVALDVRGPAQVRPGEEFAIGIALPGSHPGAQAMVELRYDPAVVQLVGGAEAGVRPPTDVAQGLGRAAGRDPGRTQVELRGPAVAGAAGVPTEVRFRVTGAAATSTQIQVGDISAVTSTGLALSVLPPAPVMVSVAPGAR